MKKINKEAIGEKKEEMPKVESNQGSKSTKENQLYYR